ncbi:hypothetical protein E1180_21110 [Roseibium denhamense]|uniref:DNA-binding transcriptional activator of the SARP family n=1 Tax=Roseibium denhamense TaxID=76305 RepID=A0ABY1NQE2_9HYPH|nr:BTAD domain-containing putative transcriptional regulator [Roseibium denhamense]MTI08006.1 hypothetical protein [Roseibium denhamense]SMP15578.1 DNA-binding transcriptional activator of the SARP family [Roseibium denhamense]
MANGPYFACLGRPLLIGADGDPISVKTRKALAILGYLIRQRSMGDSRDRLADLLWSNAERLKAMQSLRQALKQLKSAETEAGVDYVMSSSGHLHVDSAVFQSDLLCLGELIEDGSAQAFRAAAELWRGDFLAGYEDLDPEFGAWLVVERERINADIFSLVLKDLDPEDTSDDGVRVEAGALFLLKMDPAFETAHRVLMRLYLALGQRERAEHQLKSCERELQLHLDIEPSEETRALLEDQLPRAAMGHGVPAARQARDQRALQQTAKKTGEIILPSVSILSSEINKQELIEIQHLKDEVIAGLSGFRSYDLYEGGGGFDDPASSMLVNGSELGSYLLKFRHNEQSGKTAIQFEDRADGRIVFNEIVDLRLWDSVHAAASHTISRIHLHTTNRLRDPKNSAAFARWCQAEALMWEFDPGSDRKALQLLEELEGNYNNFSMVFSAKAMINLKHLVNYPVKEKDRGMQMDSILSLCERAVTLDPWQPWNQRAHGWALLQSDMPDMARRAFLQAGRLNTVDPTNLMSVAEGLAFSGDVALARRNAEEAMSLVAAVPRLFYEYYANVYFASEDYDMAAKFVERASQSSISGLTTRVAALVCAGREPEALQVLERYREKYDAIVKNTGLGLHNPEEWAAKSNFFQDPRTRHRYDQGVTLVKRFFFGGGHQA